MYYRFQASCISRIGKIRDDNEDNVYFDGRCLETTNDGLKQALYTEGDTERPQIFAVFDGMGGEEYGEAAAAAAAEMLREQVRMLNETAVRPSSFLKDCTEEMNEAVFVRGKSLGQRRIGTTSAVLYAALDSLHICNIGDSRIYRYRRRKLEILSEDDTFKNPAMKNQSLTQFLGVDTTKYSLTPHIRKGELKSGDLYLICTDGLYNAVSEEKIAALLSKQKKDLVHCAEALADTAETNGGEDNCSIVLLKILTERKILFTKGWR